MLLSNSRFFIPPFRKTNAWIVYPSGHAETTALICCRFLVTHDLNFDFSCRRNKVGSELDWRKSRSRRVSNTAVQVASNDFLSCLVKGLFDFQLNFKSEVRADGHWYL